MAEDNTKPIIVKKIRRGGHGHHGGAWKIAYADFVTAMMAFFLLLWLLGSTTEEEKQAISDFFQNPSPMAGPGGASTSMIKLGGGQDVTHAEGETKRGVNEEDRVEAARPMAPDIAEVGRIAMDDKQRLLDLKRQLEQAIEASVALRPFKDQLLLEITKEGLRVQIIDRENRPMFTRGSSRLQPYAAQILREIAPVISQVPNMISLSGHTDAIPFATFSRNYTNWELSADRANASRRELIYAGMDESKVARVVGLASTVLLDKNNPASPINRRISIIVLNKESQEAILQDDGQLEQAVGEARNTLAPAAPDIVPDVAPAIVPPAP